jgi:hypothetical protein
MALVPTRHFVSSEEPQNIRFRGLRVNYTNTTTITINVNSPFGKATVPVTNGTNSFAVPMKAAKTCVITTAGAGGLHNSLAEANSTLYLAFFAFSTVTHQLAPFFVPNNTIVDAALIAALTGGITTFDYWSSCVGFVRNDGAGNFIKFENSLPGVFRYLPATLTDTNVLTNGVAQPGPTLVDCSALVPYTYYGEIFGRFSGDNTSNDKLSFGIQEYDGTTYIERVLCANVDNEAGEYQTPSGYFIMGDGDGRGPQQVMYYTWSAAPSTGLTIRVTGARLKGF